VVFSWIKRQRRLQLLETPFPEAWLAHLERNVRHYPRLSPREQALLRDQLRVFIAEKYWEGCGGLQLTDEMQVTIAALACLLVLGLEHDYYPRVITILLYPRHYRLHESEIDELGIVHDPATRLGEARQQGVVILSWADVLRGARKGKHGQNLVLHEFAHQLDMEDRSIDGTPPLASREAYRRWHQVMTAEYERHVEAAEGGHATLLDQYGALNEAEFFAVATECFFEQPVELQAGHSELYALLRDYYHQDPAAWE